MNSLLAALQFFTALPVHKELPLGKKEVSGMYIALPFVGLAIGLLTSAAAFMTADINSFLTAVLMLLAALIATGGLHADGFADLGDAFFSYRDRDKRLAIMEDPRLGAFGTLSLLVLLSLKIGIFIELQRISGGWILLSAVPMLSRASLAVYFASTETAKESGIAHFFKQQFLPKRIIVSAVLTSLAAAVITAAAFESLLLGIVLIAVQGAAVYLYKRFSRKHFGGVTGDLCGAFIEGMEVILWLAAIVCILSGI